MFFAASPPCLANNRIGPVAQAAGLLQGQVLRLLPIMIPLVAGKGVDAVPAPCSVVDRGWRSIPIGTFSVVSGFALPSHLSPPDRDNDRSALGKKWHFNMLQGCFLPSAHRIWQPG